MRLKGRSNTGGFKRNYSHVRSRSKNGCLDESDLSKKISHVHFEINESRLKPFFNRLVIEDPEKKSRSKKIGDTNSRLSHKSSRF